MAALDRLYAQGARVLVGVLREDLSAAIAIRAQALGIKPLARFLAFATAGYKPEEMGIGPVFAIPKALKLAGISLDQVDVFELN